MQTEFEIKRDELAILCRQSLQDKGLYNNEFYKARLKEEFKEVVNQNEYDYFLDLFQRKVKFPKNENNLLIPFLLGIVDEFDISIPPNYIQGEFPDIDTDYLPVVRDYLKNVWAPKEFGPEKVCNIGNYTTFAIKSSLIDMARVHGYDRNEILAITTKLGLKDDEGKVLTWEKALEQNKELAEYCQRYPDVAKAAARLVNRNRGRGKHAGGLVISSIPLSNFVPLVVDEDGNPVSAWVEGLHDQDLQPVGLIKYDLLVIGDLKRKAVCCKLIKDRHGLTSICAVPGGSDWSDTSYLNDPKALATANIGDTKGIFQFESSGMRELVRKGGVNSFEDLVAYTALYRPGPLGSGMAERYIERKNYRESYEIHALLQPILKKTYGVMCIHEDTKISFSNGIERPIKDVKIGDAVHSVDLDTYKIEPQECHGCGPTKKCDGVSIVLENGFSVILTKDHNVLTYNGWKEAGELNDDDLIAVPKVLKQNKSNKTKIADWLGDNKTVSYFLGQLVGDGILTNTSLEICSGTLDQHRLLFSWLENKFENKLKFKEYFHCRSWYIRVSGIDLAGNFYGNRKQKLTVLLEDLSLKGKDCFNKFVPNDIFISDKETRAAFLAGLFDSDGHSSENGCHITSVSNEVIQGCRKLLLMEGINSYITNNRIHINNIDKFNKLVKKYLVIKKIVKTNQIGINFGWYPREELVRLQKESGLSIRSFCKKNKISRNHFKTKSHKFIRACFIDALQKNDFDVVFIKIKSKQIIKNASFYGMSVAKNHNLIANGIVVKNCYQEQVMQVLNAVGRIPLKDCEIVRKAISKKKEKIFAKYKDMFINNGQIVLNWTKAEVENLWGQIVTFAEYGFNRSHAVAYTFLSSQLLYLKAHYPEEFYAATLQSETKDVKIKETKLDTEKHNIKVESIDLNKSKEDFEIIDGKIYMGFSKIKGVGKEISEEIVKNQPYNNFEDFLHKFGTDAKVIKPLVCLGIFGEDKTYEELFKFYEYYKKIISSRKSRDARQMGVRDKIYKTIEELCPSVDAEKICRAYANGSDFDIGEMCQNNLKQIEKELKKYKKTVNQYSTKILDDQPIYMEGFDFSKDLEDESLIKLSKLNKQEAEIMFYGFGWTHPMEKSPDYDGSKTFSQFEDEDLIVSYVELHVIEKPMEKQSKKGKPYYMVKVEDSDGVQAMLTIWGVDYNRFKEEFEYWESDSLKGHFMKVKVKRPDPGFKNYTLDSPPPQVRYKYIPKEKEDDYRVILMQRG